MAQISLIIAFVAGILSFFSPCILPIIPGFMAYISGNASNNIDTGNELNSRINTRIKTILSSVFFVLGFSIVFAIIGLLLNTALAGSSYILQQWLGWIGGVIIIVFGIHMLGIVQIPFLMMDHKIEVKKRFSISYINAFVFGAAFAAGWSPCVGAILGSVFALAVSNPNTAFILLLAYAIGLGIPFIIIGIFSEQAINLARRSSRFLRYFNIVVGILLILVGILVFTGKLNIISNLFIP